MKERLQKILSSRGLCSRRKAEELIQAGSVAVNGVTAVLGSTADPDLDEILVDGKPLNPGGSRTYLMLNKPRGYVTTLSDEKARYMHCHFSKIEWTDKGEKRHLTFADSTYGPEFEPLMEAIAKENLCPRIICESDGTQPQDALFMKQAYERARGDAVCGGI